MIPAHRERYNSSFTPERYSRFLSNLQEMVGTEIHFRVAETPVFLPYELVSAMVATSHELIRQLDTDRYRQASVRAVPAEFAVPREDAHPTFLVVDFAITTDPAGAPAYKLIELQGFPSLFGFQIALPQAYEREFGLKGLDYILDGLSLEEYRRLVQRAICGSHSPENVVLMDLQPLHQKTLPDFLYTEKLTGVKPVCITEIIKRGRKLSYRRDGTERPIRRIYNRAIVDELLRTGVKAQFDFRDDIEVEWAGHPNWYFRWSKYALPFLAHDSVPRARFLDAIASYPHDLENYVLKPLFSFAGSGVHVDVTRELLESVPSKDRHSYLLQEKVTYGGLIRTPDEPSKVEVRIMFIWLDQPRAVTTLVRLSKGKMMGVDFNKNKEWVGSSCCFFKRPRS